MGTNYKIRCSRCGSRFDLHIGFGLGTRFPLAGSRAYVVTEKPMRCPACMHPLNDSVEAFNEQVEVTYERE